jgi:hypothetical protein
MSSIIIVSSGETNLDLRAKMMYSSKYRHVPVLEDESAFHPTTKSQEHFPHIRDALQTAWF